MADWMTQHGTLVVWTLALLAGIAATLPTLLVARAAAAVPPEDRSFRDAPPLAMRIVWWPILWISHGLGPWVARADSPLAVRLRKAGLEYALTPPQFIAARLVLALVATLLACAVLHMLGTRSGGWSAAVYGRTALIAALCGWGYLAIWIGDRIALRRAALQKALPFYLDLITLCVEAGLNLQGAFQQSVDKGPDGALKVELQRVLRDVRNGRPRDGALRDMGVRLAEPSVTNLVSAMIQAEKLGMNLGPVLRAQADQRRVERFLRAEKLAMEAPVKMLFPLIAFIFPCTFIVLFFPIVVKFMSSGF